MLVQACALGRPRRRRRLLRARRSRLRALLGVGTAMVYPTLIAAVSDAVPAARSRPRRRRLPLLARLPASRSARCSRVSWPMLRARGAAIAVVAALTATSGLFVAATPWRQPVARAAPAEALRPASVRARGRATGSARGGDPCSPRATAPRTPRPRRTRARCGPDPQRPRWPGARRPRYGDESMRNRPRRAARRRRRR